MTNSRSREKQNVLDKYALIKKRAPTKTKLLLFSSFCSKKQITYNRNKKTYTLGIYYVHELCNYNLFIVCVLIHLLQMLDGLSEQSYSRP